MNSSAVRLGRSTPMAIGGLQESSEESETGRGREGPSRSAATDTKMRKPDIRTKTNREREVRTFPRSYRREVALSGDP